MGNRSVYQWEGAKHGLQARAPSTASKHGLHLLHMSTPSHSTVECELSVFILSSRPLMTKSPTQLSSQPLHRILDPGENESRVERTWSACSLSQGIEYEGHAVFTRTPPVGWQLSSGLRTAQAPCRVRPVGRIFWA
ncbi:hypothetical protein EYF80_014851 [Liparis tanakae]|uniref:Uncharacterized protein n=1 Tax=Liparis tanakae TaxID=230148 RepID=A0A4Z2ICW7_9TELE|nr:hypothetical protein EYF80_014851 [Liparis tanakae]